MKVLSYQMEFLPWGLYRDEMFFGIIGFFFESWFVLSSLNSLMRHIDKKYRGSTASLATIISLWDSSVLGNFVNHTNPYIIDN